MPFEGFLEAIIRLATCLPLPTDEMLADAAQAAGTYQAALDAGEESKFAEYAASQHAEWGDVPDAERCGAMPRRVAHLVDILMRRIQKPVPEDAALGVLGRRDLRAWAISEMGCKESEITNEWAKEKDKGES